MMNCKNIRKKLSAYQDGEVTTTEKAAVETHLRTCEACRTEYEGLLITHRILRNLPDIEPAYGLSRQIANHATNEQGALWRQFPGKVYRWLPAGAAMVILAAAGFLIGTFMGNFITEKQFYPSQVFSTFHSDQAVTLASVQVFDATPPGSLAESYLKLTAYNPEADYEK